MRNQKQLPAAIDTNIYGKIPPQACDLEDAVLGAIMLERDAFDLCADILKSEIFYKDGSQKIYGAMQNLAHRNQPIDLLTVVQKLRDNGHLDDVGGPVYVSRLTNAVTSAANIQSHSAIVMQKFLQRELIRMGGELIHTAYEDTCDVFDLIETTARDVAAVNPFTKTGYKKIDVILMGAMKKIEDLRHSDKELTGIDTGYIDLNRLTCGWQQPDLIVIAARPSVGKTAFALNLTRNACKTGVPTGFFSLEMSEQQLINRLLAMESGILLENINRGKLDDEVMKRLYDTGTVPLSNLPFYIDDTPALSIIALRSKIRRMVKEFGLGLVIIDYIQLMSGVQNSRSDNREQEVSKISRDLKGLAKEIKIPIIALSQLSRKVEDRKEKTPVLSDLRESGAIEQDADAVIFMYRPEYYGINVDANGDRNAGETHLRFAKHRNGVCDTIKLRANLSIQKFLNWDANSSISFPRALNEVVKSAMMDTSDEKYF